MEPPPVLVKEPQPSQLHEKGAVQLLESVKPFDPEVVIGEAVVRIMVGQENNAGDVGSFWRAVSPLTKESQRAAVFSHHLTKPPNTPGPLRDAFDRTRGSGDFGAGCDIHISLMRQFPFNFSKLTLEKTREGEEKSVPPATIE